MKTDSPAPLRLLDSLDAFTEHSGRLLAWLNVAMVLLTFAVVIMRYLFDQSSIFLQESVMYLHATLFMLASAYTLKHNDHVRVDILYQRMPGRGKALVDLLGTLLLMLPVVIYIALSSWGYVLDSWAILETSPESSGIPAIFLLKTLIPVMCALLFIQGGAEVLRNGAVLLGWRRKEQSGDVEDRL
ncbi:C4-dicarboxylate ABC transporter permease [Tamilnaduibacter salinus]|uniref:TRAP transporter small permease protein n=1 Tax=Tamilnaduibacter salinus TaxID=1484056 RepID=A0A2A2I4E2_9GAMM|nr:TRAP transporter small permease subunit [Tamilnaduibacter salinus]PAV25980.1 C4-dicarboxylate ABC transporter permease [Tamilnaduibacter salinus]